ncbi:MAG: hypothetical protein AAF961_11590, partial [Planctomycetota bacterium]
GGYQDLPAADAFYANNSATPPLWGRAHANGAVAIVVGDFYSGSVYPSSFQNALFISDFGDLQLRVLRLNANGGLDSVTPLNLSVGPVVEMTMGVDGHMYYVDISGKVGRLVFTPDNAPVLAATTIGVSPPSGSGSPALGDFDVDGSINGADFLAWQRGGSPGPDATGDLDAWSQNFGDALFESEVAQSVTVDGPQRVLPMPQSAWLSDDEAPIEAFWNSLDDDGVAGAALSETDLTIDEPQKLGPLDEALAALADGEPVA